MYHGIINVYKEPGFTSFDVVAKLRGILKQKKIGHTGTLDPAAEGVLPVCLGNATKLCDLLTDKRKVYEAVLLLGVSTDTLDTTGTVLRTEEVTATAKEVLQAVKSFEGTYEQIPPMYSAIKVGGKRLYELAREGKEIERKGRPVTVFRIEVLSIELPRVRFRAECSKGTYIRSLCQDIGERIGCGGCMEHLLRQKSGRFTAETAHTLSEIEQMRDEGRLEELILPLEAVFTEYPGFQVMTEYKKLIDNGNPLPQEALEAREVPSQDASAEQSRVCVSVEAERDAAAAQSQAGISEKAAQHPDLKNPQPCGKIRVYNTEGRFCAVYEWNPEKAVFWPDKIFPADF